MQPPKPKGEEKRHLQPSELPLPANGQNASSSKSSPQLTSQWFWELNIFHSCFILEALGLWEILSAVHG